MAHELAIASASRHVTNPSRLCPMLARIVPKRQKANDYESISKLIE